MVVNRIIAIATAAALIVPGPFMQRAQAQAEPPVRPAAPQEQQNWLDVPLAPGQTVEVLTIDGNWHKGRLRLVTDEGITFDSGRPPIRHDEVWQVYGGGRPSWGWRGFWIGVASGVAIGLAAYYTQGDCADPTSTCAREGKFEGGAVVASALVFGAIGALLGRLIGGPSRKAMLVYAGPTRTRLPSGATGPRR